MGGGGVGGSGGGEDSFSLVFENSIVLIKCTLYDTVFQRQVSICRGVVFSYSFSIYCAAYHGIWCSAVRHQTKFQAFLEQTKHNLETMQRSHVFQYRLLF